MRLDPSAIGSRLEPALLAPRLGELRLVLPNARAEPGEKRGAECGRLDDLGPCDLDAEHVALELHQEIIGGGATVDLERAERATRIALHRAQDVDVLQRDALERRTC